MGRLDLHALLEAHAAHERAERDARRRLWGRVFTSWATDRGPTYAEVLVMLMDAAPGSWRELVSLPHEEVEHDGHVVPAFTWVDPERAGWRRRRWWGPVSDLDGCSCCGEARIWMPMWWGRPFTDARWIGRPRYEPGQRVRARSFHHWLPPEERW